MLGYFVEEKIDTSMSQNVALREIMTVVRRKEGTRDSRIHERWRGFFLFSFADNHSNLTRIAHNERKLEFYCN